MPTHTAHPFCLRRYHSQRRQPIIDLGASLRRAYCVWRIRESTCWPRHPRLTSTIVDERTIERRVIKARVEGLVRPVQFTLCAPAPELSALRPPRYPHPHLHPTQTFKWTPSHPSSPTSSPSRSRTHQNCPPSTTTSRPAPAARAPSHEPQSAYTSSHRIHGIIIIQ